MVPLLGEPFVRIALAFCSTNPSIARLSSESKPDMTAKPQELHAEEPGHYTKTEGGTNSNINLPVVHRVRGPITKIWLKTEHWLCLLN
ncbi:Hypothetical protein NTJ_02029 [Nesidiocoris tenuis]|uniref:Uncharacterized protein n=1 Tax=Nesidiocoris tenuis TaxID=355587 RepID=A0ABN7AD82_9HEMI|nr:Hypothetical protein NTJ_02029 [Nesidiocoris tenuis]